MIKKPAFITIEDASGTSDLRGLAPMILDEIDNLDAYIIEDTDYYFVLKLIYDELTEVQDITSLIGYILVQEGIYRYTITLNLDE